MSIAQVQVLKFMFKSLSLHDSDLPDPHLTFTRPGPEPELDNDRGEGYHQPITFRGGIQSGLTLAL